MEEKREGRKEERRTHEERGGEAEVSVDLEDRAGTRRVQAKQVRREVALERILHCSLLAARKEEGQRGTYRELVVKFARVPELRPARGAPNLLPARVGVGACAIAAVDETSRCGSDDLVVGIVFGGLLRGGVVARDGVPRIQADKVRKMTVGVARRVHIDLPFCMEFDIVVLCAGNLGGGR